MSHDVSVTEVRNALRCPRVFALGRHQGKQVAFPLGASSLGSAFHRIVDALTRGVTSPPSTFAKLTPGSNPDTVAQALSAWSLLLLGEELQLNAAYSSMPEEVDELADALREFSAYLAKRIGSAVAPAKALESFLAQSETPIESEIDAGMGVVIQVKGRLDALHLTPNGVAEVVEYKLTDGANEEIDRAQVALYRTLLLAQHGPSATPIILRFNPGLTETRLTPSTADELVTSRVKPVLQQMPKWIEDRKSAPATTRVDLCPACPMRAACAETYGDHLSKRDDPPASAARPRPDVTGGLLAAFVPSKPPATVATVSKDGNESGEAARLRDRIVSIFKQQCVAVTVTGTKEGARVIAVEVTPAHGRVRAIDRAAEDVQHKLTVEDNLQAKYKNDKGHRTFEVARKLPRLVMANALFEREAEWLAARAGRFIVGEKLGGETLRGDLSEPSCCHVLVGGQAGSGKSVLLRCVVASLAQYQPPSAVRFRLVDPKRVTFQPMLAGLSAHLQGPIYHDVESTLPMLEDLVAEMEERYRLFEATLVQDIQEFNNARAESDRLARHVVIVDEFADLMSGKEHRESFARVVRRLGAKARAAGIHLILATQRPTREHVPPSVKANLSGRIALRVTSGLESRIILDELGAEDLLGKGDLLANLGDGTHRAQAPVETAPEVAKQECKARVALPSARGRS